MTRYDILPPAQARLLPRLTALRALGLVLYGGTAIALRLGHRISIDFHFFTDRVIDRNALIAAAPFLADAQILQDEKDTWTVLTRDDDASAQSVKLSFFSGLGFGRVGDTVASDNGELSMASLVDLLGHKLKVLLQRVEVKDYLDIAAILRSGETLERGMGAAMALFPTSFPPTEALRALVYFGDGDLRTLTDVTRAELIGHIERFTMPTPIPLLSKHLST